MELRFEFEQARKENPRLKVRLKHCFVVAFENIQGYTKTKLFFKC